MEFLLASANAHKAQELNSLLNQAGVKIAPSLEKLDVIEDGSTFQANALLKAKAYFKKFGRPSVADDSGLVIPKRSDILGIHSARYASEVSDYKEKNEILLKDISNLSGSDREAYFVCYLCFYLSDEEIFFFEGRVHGVIAQQQSGKDGFGYDPVFLPSGKGGKSLAELPEWKMSNSHRAKASLSAINFFKEYKSYGQKQ